jgi:DNA-binding HxlR family transcriptional regulator
MEDCGTVVSSDKRFSELRKLIPNITEKMLSLQLKDLERDGIVARKVYREIPPKVEYYMTDFGKTLIPMLEEIAVWGRNLAKSKGKVVDKAVRNIEPGKKTSTKAVVKK